MASAQLKPVSSPNAEETSLLSEISEAQQALIEAEAELADEQAAVNAFRMHCRLKLDRWIDRLQEVQIERQSLRTQVELLRQAAGYGVSYDSENPFWQGETGHQDQSKDPNSEEELILPTDVPRDKEAEKRLYRQLARKFHPDLGSTAIEIAYRTEMMAAVNTAYESSDIQALYDLAGEMDPQQMAILAAIASPKIRRMRSQLVRLKQRRRRAQRRLESLRQENTARLWQKARRLDRNDLHWWEIVRREIESAILKIEDDISHLNDLVEQLEIEQGL